MLVWTQSMSIGVKYILVLNYSLLMVKFPCNSACIPCFPAIIKCFSQYVIILVVVDKLYITKESSNIVCISPGGLHNWKYPKFLDQWRSKHNDLYYMQKWINCHLWYDIYSLHIFPCICCHVSSIHLRLLNLKQKIITIIIIFITCLDK